MVNEKMISNLHSQLLAVDQPLAALQALGHSQDPLRLAVTDHLGGARVVHMQTL